MHSNVTIKNVSWSHFSWATLYAYIFSNKNVPLYFGLQLSFFLESEIYSPHRNCKIYNFATHCVSTLSDETKNNKKSQPTA